MGFFAEVGKAVVTHIASRYGGASGGAIFRGATMGSGSMQPKGGKDLIQAYSETPWLRATISKKASSFSSLEWEVKRTMNQFGNTVPVVEIQVGKHAYRQKAMAQMTQDGQAQIVEGHPLPALLKNPCPALPGSTPLFLAQVYYDVLGEAFFYVDRGPRDAWIQGKSAFSGMPQPTGLWPLPPMWITRTPTPSDPTYDVRNGTLSLLGVPRQDILWLKQPDPLNPYARGLGYAQAVRDEVAADESAARMISYSFANRGRPDLLVALKGASQKEIDAMRNDWVANLQGVQNALKTHFVNVEAQVEKLTYDFEHLQVLELRDFNKKLLRQTQGIPPEILGDQDQSNRSTSDAAQHIYNTQVVIPLADVWREFFQAQLLPEYDPRAVLDYVTPVAEDREFALESIGSGVPVKVNEARSLAGFEPLTPAEGGDMWLVGGALQATLVDAAAAPGALGAPAADGAAPSAALGPQAALFGPGGISVPHASGTAVSLDVGGQGAPPVGKGLPPKRGRLGRALRSFVPPTGA